MIPHQLKYTVEGSTPSFTDNQDQHIEKDTQVRLRIKGIRGEIGQMFAIGSIREDYLGYVPHTSFAESWTSLTLTFTEHFSNRTDTRPLYMNVTLGRGGEDVRYGREAMSKISEALGGHCFYERRVISTASMI